MDPVIIRLLAVVVCAGLSLAGCTSSANEPPRTETATTSTANTATTTTTEPATPVPVRPECVDVADKANELLSRVVRLANGDATTQQVRAAADELSDSFDNAKAAVEPDAAADLDEAGQALGRVRDVLTAQPVDTAELQTAANDLLTSLGDAAAICTPGSPTTSTEDSGSGTGPATPTTTNPGTGPTTPVPTY